MTLKISDRIIPILPLLHFGADSRLNLLTTRLGAVQKLSGELLDNVKRSIDKNGNISKTEAQRYFKFRTRMEDFADNFKKVLRNHKPHIYLNAALKNLFPNQEHQK